MPCLPRCANVKFHCQDWVFRIRLAQEVCSGPALLPFVLILLPNCRGSLEEPIPPAGTVATPVL